MSNAAPRTVLENDFPADITRFGNFFNKCFESESSNATVAKAMRNEQLTGLEYISVAWELIALLRLLDHRAEMPSVSRRPVHATFPSHLTLCLPPALNQGEGAARLRARPPERGGAGCQLRRPYAGTPPST